MIWNEAQAVAAEVMKNLRGRFEAPEIRLILRALSRMHHHDKQPMKTPTIIISEPKPGSYRIDVSGKFGGGFQGFTTDKAGVVSRLGLLKSYDCGDQPASVICPASLAAEITAVFPHATIS